MIKTNYFDNNIDKLFNTPSNNHEPNSEEFLYDTPSNKTTPFQASSPKRGARKSDMSSGVFSLASSYALEEDENIDKEGGDDFYKVVYDCPNKFVPLVPVKMRKSRSLLCLEGKNNRENVNDDASLINRNLLNQNLSTEPSYDLHEIKARNTSRESEPPKIDNTKSARASFPLNFAVSSHDHNSKLSSPKPRPTSLKFHHSEHPIYCETDDSIRNHFLNFLPPLLSNGKNSQTNSDSSLPFSESYHIALTEARADFQAINSRLTLLCASCLECDNDEIPTEQISETGSYFSILYGSFCELVGSSLQGLEKLSHWVALISRDDQSEHIVDKFSKSNIQLNSGKRAKQQPTKKLVDTTSPITRAIKEINGALAIMETSISLARALIDHYGPKAENYFKRKDARKSLRKVVKDTFAINDVSMTSKGWGAVKKDIARELFASISRSKFGKNSKELVHHFSAIKTDKTKEQFAPSNSFELISSRENSKLCRTLAKAILIVKSVLSDLLLNQFDLEFSIPVNVSLANLNISRMTSRPLPIPPTKPSLSLFPLSTFESIDHSPANAFRPSSNPEVVFDQNASNDYTFNQRIQSTLSGTDFVDDSKNSEKSPISSTQATLDILINQLTMKNSDLSTLSETLKGVITTLAQLLLSLRGRGDANISEAVTSLTLAILKHVESIRNSAFCQEDVMKSIQENASSLDFSADETKRKALEDNLKLIREIRSRFTPIQNACGYKFDHISKQIMDNLSGQVDALSGIDDLVEAMREIWRSATCLKDASSLATSAIVSSLNALLHI
ncbi:unnamed protein product [Gordionus sp. m RMFG-2023]|uniref:uncharacterized protein LOC135930544 n=1 Tax=Gordionus sp. m RMFG-2023 TaxID=3053472 RepID=UPI0030E46DA2